jgi:uncharacterized membrane protein
MGEFGTIMLLVLAYPFVAAWLVNLGRNSRLDRLERELMVLRAQLSEARRAPLPTAPPAGAVPVSPEGQDASVPSVPPAARDAGAAPAPAADSPTVPPTVAPTVPQADPWEHTTGAMVRPTPEPAAARAVAAPLAASAAQPLPSSAAEPVRPRQTAAPAAKPPPSPLSPPSPPSPPPPPPRWLLAARDWLFTGNLVAKLGLVILFIGVGFLLKYVAATVVVPIELRLAGVVLADLGLLAWGWRLRTARREIGLPVQGAAIAILMLVVFGAYQRYGLLPAGFTFALLVALTAFTCLLAVLQDAVWLAVFGITGGFAAPLMVATGQGNHIALFSYYALLNAGVFGLAIQRSWRPLNLLGFAFTFVVGAAWGGLRYTPDHYASTQGFLILFFLFYVGIALAYARRQRTRLKDYVDATLVLGTPLLAFGLQAGLVKNMHFGLALSALALGGFYLVLALILLRRGRERWRVLVETFTAIGVIFGTLAIPFALDGRWTSGAWALEGAGFVWYGLRRGQRRTWLFGMLLQAGAWFSFIGAAAGLDAAAARDSNLWLGFLLLAGSAFAMASGLRRYAADEAPVVARLANACLAIAAVWLLGGWWAEAILRTSGSLLANLLASGAVLTAVVLAVIAARLAWRTAGVLAFIAQLAGAAALLVVGVTGWDWFDLLEREGDKPLLGAVMIALAAIGTGRMLARYAAAVAGPASAGSAGDACTASGAGATGTAANTAGAAQAPKWLASAFLAWGGLWWFGPVINIAAGRMVFWLPSALGDAFARWTLLYALMVTLSAVVCTQLARRLQWPQLRRLGAACWIMLALVTLASLAALYGWRQMPHPAVWLAWALLLAGGEHVMRVSRPNPARLKALHALRSGGPWLALWPAGGILVERWLAAAPGMQVADGAWATGAAWSNYLPTWAMMAVLALLLRRSRADGWPTRPLADWYRGVLVPGGAVLVLILVAVWNLGQDGTMAPLPYLPLLNPLDLTTGFALALWVACKADLAARPGQPPRVRTGVRIAGLVLAYAWFNLILLRSAAHYLEIPYQFEDLAASQFVQAMLSLVWSASALVIMRYAAQRAMRRTWSVGAVLLGIVVCKLFMADLANGGSMARIVSFVGAGVLMLLIGYFAPFPKAVAGDAAPGAAARAEGETP